MTSYNPAHYRAEASYGWPGAQIWCTQCIGAPSIVYTIEATMDGDDPQTMDLIINATRQHHDDHHEGK